MSITRERETEKRFSDIQHEWMPGTLRGLLLKLYERGEVKGMLVELGRSGRVNTE